MHIDREGNGGWTQEEEGFKSSKKVHKSPSSKAKDVGGNGRIKELLREMFSEIK